MLIQLTLEKLLCKPDGCLNGAFGVDFRAKRQIPRTIHHRVEFKHVEQRLQVVAYDDAFLENGSQHFAQILKWNTERRIEKRDKLDLLRGLDDRVEDKKTFLVNDRYSDQLLFVLLINSPLITHSNVCARPK